MDDLLNVSDKELLLEQKNEKLSSLEAEFKECDEKLKELETEEQDIGGN